MHQVYFFGVFFATCQLGYSESEPTCSIKRNDRTPKSLATFAKRTVIVHFRNDGTTAGLASIRADLPRGQRITAVVDSVEKQSSDMQRNVLSALTATDANGRRLTTHNKVTQLKIFNKMVVNNATEETINMLNSFPEVERITLDQQFELEVPYDISTSNIGVLGIQWGVDRVGAPSLWDNIDASEIIVANIDTGVRYSHEILKKNYVGDYGWFDPYEGTSVPNDDQGHGTHTMGTIAGSNGFGVAPSVKWMACKGCTRTGCQESGLLKCAEFLTCPTDPNGNNRDCSKAPHVINNSWGGGQGNFWYQQAIDTWHAAGIIPIFSAGNSGSDCSTANSPGDYPNVISVGSTTSQDRVSSFSSLGPTVRGLLKPDIAAPGSAIRSAYITTDSSYSTMSGTSMAAPHVTGLVALMLAVNPELSFDSVRLILQQTADQSSLLPPQTCGEASRSFPNNFVGAGIANSNAIKLLLKQTRAPAPPAPTPTPTRVPKSAPVPVPAPTPSPPINKYRTPINKYRYASHAHHYAYGSY